MDMEQGGTPPIISEVGAETKTVSRGRWWIHLGVLTIFPLVPAVMGLVYRQSHHTILPKTVGGLLGIALFELMFFVLLFGFAWLASRANADQLLLHWRRGVLPVVLGFAYSFALRLAIMALLVAVVFAWWLLTAIHNGFQNGINPTDIQQFRPQTEQLINAQALVNSPIYLVICLTLISFVVAGLREELWRSGMLAGIAALFPKQFANWRGKAAGIVAVSLLFGLGHTAQGVAGVCVTGVLGIGLGIIMVAHRSIWEAVIAHGFFDSSTFLALYLLTKYHPGLVPGL